jgi:hypothetical protein
LSPKTYFEDGEFRSFAINAVITQQLEELYSENYTSKTAIFYDVHE